MKQILVILCCLYTIQAAAQEQDPYDIEPKRQERYSKTFYEQQGNAYGVGAMTLINTAGNGYGLQFQYFPMHDARLALVVPVSVNFAILDHTYTPRPAMYFISPGFRRYTGNPKHAVRYAWGLNLMLGSGKGVRDGYENGTNQNLQSRSVFGLTFDNSMYIQCSKHIHIALDLGLGFGYDDGFWYGGATPLGQLSLGLGYSW
jgi:hypothetical protein